MKKEENLYKNVLVTGSEGYIGTVLIPLLIQQGYNVTGLDTCYYGKHSERRKYCLIKQDIRKIQEVDFHQFQAIIHLAALSNDPTCMLDTKLTSEINYEASVNLAQKAKKQGVKRFLFSSSCSIYGITKNQIVNENSVINPLTTYAQSKTMAEKELIKLADAKFEVGILRNSTVYGWSPNFRIDLVVNNLLSWALATKEIRVMSDGTPWRPLIDVRDLSFIFLEFLKAESKIINNIYNIGFNQNNFQVKNIIDKIKDQISDCKIIYTGEHGKDTRSYRVDFSKFAQAFPQIKQQWYLEKSIRNMINNLRKIHFDKLDLKSGKYTRLEALKELKANKKVNSDIFWY